MTGPLISSGRKSKFYPTVSERMAGCQKLGKQIFYRLREGWSWHWYSRYFFKKDHCCNYNFFSFLFCSDIRIKLIKFKQWPKRTLKNNSWGRWISSRVGRGFVFRQCQMIGSSPNFTEKSCFMTVSYHRRYWIKIATLTMLCFHIYSAEQKQQWDPVTTRAQDISKKNSGRGTCFLHVFSIKSYGIECFLKMRNRRKTGIRLTPVHVKPIRTYYYGRK